MDQPVSTCLNCGVALKGKYCYDCGQKVTEPNERTLKHLIYQFIGSAFFLENNFLKNVWTLISRPGRLPLDFIEGRRRRWMPPFSLFLLINLFYFWYSPLTDLDLRLHEQVRQHHAKLATYLVNKRLEERKITFEEYAEVYNKKSTAYSNSLIVLGLPVFAFFMSLLYYRKKYFFIDHFIYVLYFFAFILLITLLQSGLLILVAALIGVNRVLWQISGFAIFALIVVYTFQSLRTTYAQKSLHAALMVVPVMAAFTITHFIYRTLLFLIIFCAT